MSSRAILKKYWGFDSFRPLQEEVIREVLEGRDTLALLATGAGKSICFQIPALATEGVTIVISPLIALMKDQVDQLKSKGIAAEAVYSGISLRNIDRILDNAVYGGVKLLYLSPERLLSDLAIARIKSMQVNLIAVDEAHCISQWGYDFRPSYLRINQLREWHPNVPILALTATATAEVTQDIQKHLGFRKPNVIQSSFARNNIALRFKQVEVKESVILKELGSSSESAIIYAYSRKQAKTMSDHLNRHGLHSDFYHAGLTQDERLAKQKAWHNDQVPIMVSTNAFGMGIDKPNVRKVIHLHLPNSIEAYFQEAGRAGRDGKPSEALMLFYEPDKGALIDRIEQAFPKLRVLQKVYEALGGYLNLAVGSGHFESFSFEIGRFAKNMHLDLMDVHHSLQILERYEYLTLSEQRWQASTVWINVSSKHIYNFDNNNPKFSPLLKSVLRSYQNIGQEPTFINEGNIARQLGCDFTQVVRQLEMLDKENLLEYNPRKEHPQLTFLKPRLRANDITIDLKQYRRLKEVKLKAAKAMIALATTQECRQKYILEYFDQGQTEPCGICDNCTKGEHIQGNVKDVMKRVKYLNPESIIDKDIDNEVLMYLLDEGIIYQRGHQYIKR